MEGGENFEAELESALWRAKKVSHVGAPAVFALEMECRILGEAFDCYGIYLVGSAVESPDHRDVDLRMIMEDGKFFELFPDAGDRGSWEFDPRWLVMTVSISERLSRLTGLAVDFQFHPQSHANKHFKGPRHPMGLRVSRRSETKKDG
jgi:hypothetical protein